jgi:hypothetical protein
VAEPEVSGFIKEQKLEVEKRLDSVAPVAKREQKLAYLGSSVLILYLIDPDYVTTLCQSPQFRVGAFVEDYSVVLG